MTEEAAKLSSLICSCPLSLSPISCLEAASASQGCLSSLRCMYSLPNAKSHRSLQQLYTKGDGLMVDPIICYSNNIS